MDNINQQEFKHVCKLCYKRFPSGKSLGGHMRSHVIAAAKKNKLLSSDIHNNNNNTKKVSNFAENYEVDDVDVDVDVDDDDDQVENEDCNNDIIDRNNVGSNSGYGLRENPKKTWRIVNSKFPPKLHQNNPNNNNNDVINNSNNNEVRICKKCGKGFHSLKALCGHMSIHSNKDRNFNKEEDDNYSWSSDSIDQLFLAMESHSSDNNNNNNSSKPQTRSRYKSFSNNNNNVDGSSSNYSEIDQLEQEEVAMCLMMLSRDSSGCKNWVSFGAVESSDDNNSVILQGGLFKSNNNTSNNVVVSDDNGKKKVDDHHEMDNSDSGYFENGAKEIESDDSNDGFLKNYEFLSKNNNMFEVGSRLVDCFGSEDNNDMINKKRRFRDVGSFESNENYSSKKIKHDYFRSSNNNSPTKNYECWICHKFFKTHQALGGHIISHRKNGEKSLYTSNNSNANAKNLASSIKKGSGSKKVKGHKCPYCPRVFKSGQALGGHKRSHMMGSNNVGLHSDQGRLNHVPTEVKQPLIDLNLPAPMDEETSGDSQFVTW